MVIDVVDSDDKPVDTVRRKNVLPQGLNFRTVHIFILNKKRDKILLQQLSDTRRRHPGYFGSSVAAYLFSGESYLDAANRRLYQELGIKPDHVNFHWCGKEPMTDKRSLKFVGLYKVIYEGYFNPDESHIKDVEWVKIRNINDIIRSKNFRTTPTFRHVWSIFKNSKCYKNVRNR